MTILDSREDFFNTKHTRNRNNTAQRDYNCGGWALRTFSWWRPFRGGNTDYYSAYDFVSTNNLKYNTVRTMDQALLKYCINILLKEFPELERVYEPSTSERIIAFRIGTYYQDDEERGLVLEDWDFHFKVKEKNTNDWTHKMGGHIIEDTDCLDTPWEIPEDEFEYESEIIYFVDRRENVA